MDEGTHNKAYGKLLLMTVISFAAMYGLMYAMVNTWPNVVNNFNQVYMAGLMASAMILIELGVMRSMYTNKGRNLLFFGVGVLALLGFWFAIRSQAAISDRQFLRSMIPHHASAILMCEEASLEDPEIKKLCQDIVTGQQAEIELMKAKLQEIEGR